MINNKEELETLLNKINPIISAIHSKLQGFTMYEAAVILTIIISDIVMQAPESIHELMLSDLLKGTKKLIKLKKEHI